MNTFLFYDSQWFGNLVVPAIGVVAVAWIWAKQKPRLPSLAGAFVGVAACLIAFSGVLVHSQWLRDPPPGVWLASDFISDLL